MQQPCEALCLPGPQDFVSWTDEAGPAALGQCPAAGKAPGSRPDPLHIQRVRHPAGVHVSP